MVEPQATFFSQRIPRGVRVCRYLPGETWPWRPPGQQQHARCREVTPLPKPTPSVQTASSPPRPRWILRSLRFVKAADGPLASLGQPCASARDTKRFLNPKPSVHSYE